MSTSQGSAEEQELILSELAPSLTQKRLALGVVVILLVGFILMAGPLSHIQLARINAFVPAYAAAMLVNDSITAVLLFAQFSILRSRALLAISSGYLFTALILVPWMLTFPGIFAPSGLLGAGLQTTAWLYIVWYAGFPAFVIAYTILKDRDPAERLSTGSVSVAILSSVAATASAVCAATFLVIAGDEFLPHLMIDTIHLSGFWPYAAGFASLSSLSAAALLWRRRRSVLDLWLVVIMCAYVIEICLISFPTPNRYSIGWYGGRVFGLVSGSLVLFVLLYEITTLYARLLRAVLAQRRERQARLMTADALSASIAHEIKQPLSAMMANAAAGAHLLDRSRPDLEEAKLVFQEIVVDGRRAGAVIESIRAIFKKDARSRSPLNIDELIRETLALLIGELRAARIAVRVQAHERLPRVNADRVQLQQVFVNLIMNAIDSMAANERPRVLGVTSEVHSSGGVIVSVTDTGAGVDPKQLDRIFNPLFTTKSQGMGMGLSICRSIIEAHDGQLWAVANGSNGAVFQFVLPAHPADHSRMISAGWINRRSASAGSEHAS
ncbi:MASE4 domain-containing protein [Bradyrhizobium diazoefficiens]|uniref:sensor histidine kinase n=1 Tax=Bradyrhizobium diazoefficiens TaxID=1355477 RepID=UPI001909C95F|nr:MASE4 domain-containing protein [Bradyrhizobium diazoefficiens]QQO36288.1 MASE4 domain-containing protein [Bradyrhizobium diazoefficiens]